MAALAYIVVVSGADPFARSKPLIREAGLDGIGHISLLLSVVSCGFAFPVISVQWEFFGLRLDRAADRGRFDDAVLERLGRAGRRGARWLYSWAWRLAVAGGLGFAILVGAGHPASERQERSWPTSSCITTPTRRSPRRCASRFGIKQLAWKSVMIPNIMPKPDLMPLTGGYRKTPVMQVGADIYCDTQLIMLEIERRAAEAAVAAGRPGGRGAGARDVGRPQHLLVRGRRGDGRDRRRGCREAFKKDRSEFSGRSFDAERLKAAQPMARDQTYAQLSLAEQMLRDGRPFLLGAVPSLADCALYNPVWFIQSPLGAARRVAARPAAEDRRLVASA